MNDNTYYLSLWIVFWISVNALTSTTHYFYELEDQKLIKANCEQIAAITGTNHTLALCALKEK